MSELSTQLRQQAELFEKAASLYNAAFEAAVEQIKSAGVNEDVAHGMAQETLPTYVELWDKLMQDPAKPAMSDPLAYYQLMKQAADKLDELENQANQDDPILQKLAELGVDANLAASLPRAAVEKLAAEGMSSAPRELGAPAQRNMPKSDPLAEFCFN